MLQLFTGAAQDERAPETQRAESPRIARARVSARPPPRSPGSPLADPHRIKKVQVKKEQRILCVEPLVSAG